MPGFPETVRTFTAVELDAPVLNAIATEAPDLLRGLGKVSPVPKRNLHVTLKFIGPVHRDDLADLADAVAAGAKLLSPGRITVEGIGAFPNLSRPRVIWVGVSDPSGILSPVHSFLNDALADFGAKRERKRYVPHVTLARVRGAFDAEEFGRRIAMRSELRFGTQEVRKITLFMSETSRGGAPSYTTLARYTNSGPFKPQDETRRNSDGER